LKGRIARLCRIRRRFQGELQVAQAAYHRTFSGVLRLRRQLTQQPVIMVRLLGLELAVIVLDLVALCCIRGLDLEHQIHAANRTFDLQHFSALVRPDSQGLAME
jgi:hypothetical protein